MKQCDLKCNRNAGELTTTALCPWLLSHVWVMVRGWRSEDCVLSSASVMTAKAVPFSFH